MATKAYVGLGANLGDAKATLEKAIGALDHVPGFNLRAVSRLYATKPVGVEDQPEFRNAVAALDVPSGPNPQSGALALLVALKQLEESFGRKPRQRWGPRELDLDLLAFGRSEISVERPKAARSKSAPARLLVVPHPEAPKRLFVLAPWADVAGAFAPPGWGETVATARRRRALLEGEDGVRAVGEWDPKRRRWLHRPSS
ncbi:MAG: 2-amino-4-hydroxy-6-hydroxymethyldihydropteridine diphosphokinase [Chloroflexi bacterium]|nr:2-amino-4-hydroxy-6-hydroxymethyldihydropteridine diphosphokinase [Chloroflexota bacterium]